MSDLFSVEETQKRRIKDLNRELLHVRNLAEKLREDAKRAQQQNERLKAEAVASATEIDSLKTQLNNMERCYIDVKKERDDLVSKNEPKNKRPDPSTCIHEPVSCWLVVECAKCGVML